MIIQPLAVTPGAKLDLGCGPRKCAEDFLGVDLLDKGAADIVGDVFEVLAGLSDGHVSEVHAAHFLEHFEDPQALLREIARVVRPEGRCTIVVPHFSNPYYYSDLTHRRPWGLYSISYLVATSPFKRAVPSYDEPLPFTIESVHMGFKSPRPFYVRYAFKQVIERVVNAHRGAQEFYEENLAWMIPCYELRFVLRRD